MTKTFCDICSQPAAKLLPEKFSVKHGKTYISFKTDGPASGNQQALIVVSVRFGFEKHESGFGGPPDLCSDYAVNLLEKLVQQEKNKTRLIPKQKSNQQTK